VKLRSDRRADDGRPRSGWVNGKDTTGIDRIVWRRFDRQVPGGIEIASKSDGIASGATGVNQRESPKAKSTRIFRDGAATPNFDPWTQLNSWTTAVIHHPRSPAHRPTSTITVAHQLHLSRFTAA
jgi:hypothetical protein